MKRYLFLLFTIISIQSFSQLKHEIGIGFGRLGSVTESSGCLTNTFFELEIPLFLKNNVQLSNHRTQYAIFSQKGFVLPTIYYTLYFKKRFATRVQIKYSTKEINYNPHTYCGAWSCTYYWKDERKFVDLSTSIGGQFIFLKRKRIALYSFADIFTSYGKYSISSEISSSQKDTANIYKKEYQEKNRFEVAKLEGGLGIQIPLIKKVSFTWEIACSSNDGFNFYPISRFSLNYFFKENKK